MSGTPQEREEKRRAKESKGGSLGRELLIIVGVALVLSVLVRTFVAQAFFVPSSSMEDTLLVQDRILASKLTTELGGVHRGEIVVFTDPGGWLPDTAPPTGVSGAIRKALMFVGLLPSDTGEDLVKRVIGVGGDRIACCDREGPDHRATAWPSTSRRTSSRGARPTRCASTCWSPKDASSSWATTAATRPTRATTSTRTTARCRSTRVVGRVVAVVWPASRWSGEPVPVIFENPEIDAQAGKVGAPKAVDPADEASNPDGG